MNATPLLDLDRRIEHLDERIQQVELCITYPPASARRSRALWAETQGTLLRDLKDQREKLALERVHVVEQFELQLS
jgi:hypothetical protein